MKKIILITILILYNSLNAQDISWRVKAKGHNPNPKNELSKYFKKEIPKKLLNKAGYQRGKNNIILSFKINTENIPYNINVSTFGSNELYNKLKTAFKKYPLEKLNLNELDKKNRYSLQIITKKGNKNIFNCSTKVMVETPAICENCKDLQNFEDLEKCLNIEVKKHFYNTFNSSKITEDETNIFFQYYIKPDGSIGLKTTKKVSKYLDEIKRSLSTFSGIITPSYFNNVLNKPFYSLSIPFKKGEKFIYEDSQIKFNLFSKPTIDNDFSNYLAEKLTKEDINKARLNRINHSLRINFELDKDYNPFNITTNSRSYQLEKEIINAFIDYPIEKLNFFNRKKFNRYNLQILSFKDNQSVINTSTKVSYIRAPIFPGCENSSSIKDLKKCFSLGVQKHFMQKFDADLPKKLGLSKGRKRVFIGFKIDKSGEIVDIKVKAPHIVIKNEVIKVMEQLPKVIAGVQIGKNVNIKYSIPFTLIID
ncbi:hypothetical protein [Polaribacter sp. Hel1_85]|uniref:hypothetical protein n=1 Tax=Polaribacter sp. Hel1_85 TaxID=1250005 RepID=UPI00052DDE66|nr:hypothetical protein [Polaribacter sp. Hel1_85]KGL64145.1 hypothetical protein PHEL85_1197 [Polaribacter sp. Hel1_85]